MHPALQLGKKIFAIVMRSGNISNFYLMKQGKIMKYLMK